MATKTELIHLSPDGPNGHSGRLLSRGALDRYGVIVACVRGNVSVKETMRLIMKEAIGDTYKILTLILGPTAPDDFHVKNSLTQIGWVTFLDGTSAVDSSSDVRIIAPDNLLEVNLFIEKAAEGDGSLILGDFLDNIIKSSTSPESFYSFFCQLTSRVKLKGRTAVLVIKEDIHDKPMVEIVKRFADVVLEFRDHDTQGVLTVEMRTLNFADNIYTRWVPFPEGLKPLSPNNYA